MRRNMWILFVLVSILVTHSSLPAQPTKESVKLKGHDGYVGSLAFTSDAKTLVSCGGEYFKYGEIKLWDVAKGEEKSSLKGHASHIHTVVFTPDDRMLVSASDDKTIKLWDAANKKEIATLRGHTDRIWCLALSKDGKTLAAGDADGIVKLWDLATRKELTRLAAPYAMAVRAVAMTGDAKVLASGGTTQVPGRAWYYGGIQLWDVAKREVIQSLTDRGVVTSLAMTNDGKVLASGTEKGSVTLWDVSTGKELTKLKGHSGAVHSMQFSPDGKLLASAGSSDKTVKLWDVSSGTGIQSLKGHPDCVFALAFSPDGTMLASACKEIRLWDVSKVKHK